MLRAARHVILASTHVAVWIVLLVLGARILHGRYDWSDIESTHKSYLSSIFFFVFTVPTVFYVLRATRLHRAFAYVGAAFVYVLLVLPYHALELERRLVETHDWKETPAPTLTFLPETFPPVPSFPHEREFLCVWFITFAAIALGFLALHRRRASFFMNVRSIGPWLGALVVILVETWFHTGLRSGYSLNAYYAKSPGERNWYITYLLPNQLGAVSTDFKFFHAIDRYFLGIPPLPDMFVLRRPYFHYIGSQFVYFINPFYVYLTLNILMWLAAVGAMYALVMRVVGRKRLAVFAAALVCVANGFHYFVAQPKPYLAGYATVVIGVYAFDTLQSARATADSIERGWRALLSGVVLGLVCCVYDAQPLLIGLLAYAVFRRFNVARAAASLYVASRIPERWTWLQSEMLHIAPNDQNAGLARNTIKNIKAMYEEPHKGEIYHVLVRACAAMAQNLAYAFMLAALVMAFLGLVTSTRTRDRWFVVTLAVPFIALDIVLSTGGVHWERWVFAELPRFSYIVYPAVYVACALALERLAGTGRSMLRVTAAWLVVIALGVWQSADAFGYLSPSVHFYFPDQTPWLDPI